jgi:hypothetical protein
MLICICVVSLLLLLVVPLVYLHFSPASCPFILLLDSLHLYIGPRIALE